MPFKSEAQRRFMFSQHPKLAEEFADATPKGADLPEHVKKHEDMADGGVIHDSDAVKSYLASQFKIDGMAEGGKVERTELEHQEPNAMMARAMAEGGTWLQNVPVTEVDKATHVEGKKPTEDVTSMTGTEHGYGMAHGGKTEGTKLSEGHPKIMERELHKFKEGSLHSGSSEGPKVTDPKQAAAIALSEAREANKMAEGGTIHQAEGRDKEQAKPADINKSHEEKLSAIYKAMGMEKYAGGGAIPTPTGPDLGLPNPSDPTYWDKIKMALAQVGGPITKPIGAINDVVTGAAQAAVPVIPPVVSAINKLTGTSLPVPAAPAPKIDNLPPPTPFSAPVPPTVPPAATPAPTPSAGSTPAGADLKNIFNQDTSKLTEGVNAEDRQALAAKVEGQQRGAGSVIAEALAGLGDALAAKGGRDQHALKDIFSMQKQQRDEALANFDKARQDRLEKLDIQTKMGNNTINQLAAQDAYGVDEHLNKMLGAPAGTAHKDLPLYMQMKTAEIAQQEKDTDLYMKAHAQAASEIESGIKNASMFNMKPSPAQIQASGAKLADQYYNRAKGNILFQPSDGQKPVWIPAKNVQAAKQMDPHGQIIP